METQSFIVPVGTKFAKYEKVKNVWKKSVKQKDKANCFTREIGTNSLYQNVFNYHRFLTS